MFKPRQILPSPRITPYNELGWVLHLFKTLTSTPEPTSQSLHWTSLLLPLLSLFSCARLCVTPYMAAHQAPPSLGFSRQEHWSGLPFPYPMHESEKWKWSRSVMSNPQRPHGLQPTRLLRPWDFPGRSTGVGCHCLLHTDTEKAGKLRWNKTIPLVQL